jgi:hypothetical protein
MNWGRWDRLRLNGASAQAIADVALGCWGVSIRESNAAYSGLKISLAVSTRWRSQNSQNATIPLLCCQLEYLGEGFGRGCRRFGVRRIDIGQGRVERSVAEMLANKERIGTLLNHEHGRRVLQDMRVL